MLDPQSRMMLYASHCFRLALAQADEIVRLLGTPSIAAGKDAGIEACDRANLDPAPYRLARLAACIRRVLNR